jgi:hypothetical protein
MLEIEPRAQHILAHALQLRYTFHSKKQYLEEKDADG